MAMAMAIIVRLLWRCAIKTQWFRLIEIRTVLIFVNVVWGSVWLEGGGGKTGQRMP